MHLLSHKLYDHKLALLINRLSHLGCTPGHLEVAPIGGFFYANVFDDKPHNVISDRVYTGFADSPSLAIIKALVEMVEAKAFREGNAIGLPLCQTIRSDGFAAYPKTLVLDSVAKRKARSNAYMEACERYLWANWWDHSDYGFQLTEDLQKSPFAIPKTLLQAVESQVAIKALKLIEPLVDPIFNIKLVILLLEVEGGGVITGGAAGHSDDFSKRVSIIRAFGELYRHALALTRIKSVSTKELDFYERRLAYFGFGQGYDLVQTRLKANTSIEQKIPNCTIDQVIPHKLESEVVVHRCLLKDQPIFIGGKLERLCI